jgi:hypothetical protein
LSGADGIPHVAQAAGSFRVLHLACATPGLDFLGNPLRNVRLSSCHEIPAEIRDCEFEAVTEEDRLFNLLPTHPYEQISLSET